MNSKVVTVWVIGIILSFGIGIFGAANQNLLQKVDPEKEPIVPSIKTDKKVKKCTYSDDAKAIAYQFTLANEGGKVETVTISYKSNYPSHENYVAASNICNKAETGSCTLTIPGVKTTLQGDEEAFRFIATITPSKLNTATASSYIEDLGLLNMVVDYIEDVGSYEQAINNAVDGEFMCE